MYTSLSIQNFRGIHALEMNDLRRVNILTGKNNCGKTSVLEAVYLLSQSANPAIGLQVASLGRFPSISESYWHSFFHSRYLPRHIRMSACGRWVSGCSRERSRGKKDRMRTPGSTDWINGKIGTTRLCLTKNYCNPLLNDTGRFDNEHHHTNGNYYKREPE